MKKETPEQLLREQLASIGSKAAAKSAVPKARAIASEHNENEDVQLLYLQILMKAQEESDMTARLLAFHARWPENRLGLKFGAAALIKDDKIDEGVSLIESRFNMSTFDEEEWCACAILLSAAGANERSDEVFSDILETGSTSLRVAVAYAKSLTKRGLFESALYVLRPLAGAISKGSKAEALLTNLEEVIASHGSELGRRHADMRIELMLRLIEDLAESRQPPSFTGLGKTCLMTGQLAAAGAERQLARLALVLHKLSVGEETIKVSEEKISRATILDGIELDLPLKEVNVLVRSLASNAGNDFFLPELLDVGARVEQVDQGGNHSAKRSEDALGDVHEALMPLLRNMPSMVDFGVKNIYPILKGRKYDSISLWQDGAILYGAIPALLAGIPKIQLVFRGLPPNLRAYLLKPEYEPLYKALSRVPGVSFAANSQKAASAYEDWIGLEAGTVKLLHNGVPRSSSRPLKREKMLWTEFEERTGEADFTVGSVARFDHVKRPLKWIMAAIAFHKKHPNSRFIMVGDGRMRKQAEDLVEANGLQDRVLFVGHSSRVAFWYKKMDAFLLLSRHEGLPNVLIEAQLNGVQVVSTPAGGAGECFIDGQTGILLKKLKSIDIDEVVKSLGIVKSWQPRKKEISKLGTKLVKEKFSIKSGVRKYLQIW